MGADLVVVHSPVLDLGSGVAQIDKPVLVQALVAELTIEGLDVGVIGRLSWPDEVDLDAHPIGPLVQGSPRELRAVVADDDRR